MQSGDRVKVINPQSAWFSMYGECICDPFIPTKDGREIIWVSMPIHSSEVCGVRVCAASVPPFSLPQMFVLTELIPVHHG